MQDAGDSPPTGNAARGGKGGTFPPLAASARNRERPPTGGRLGVGASGRLSTLSLTVSLPDVFLNVSLNVSETDAERAARQKRHGLGKGGGVKCGKERQDAAVGAEIATVNSCGDQRGVSELRIGTANRHKQPTRRRLQKGLRRWSARESARRFARGIGAENCAGICVRNLRQEIGTEVCRDGLRRWNYVAGLKIGTARNRYKKDREKNRGHTGGVEFSGGGFGSHPYWLDKTVVVLSPIAGPEISLIASSGSRDGCTANSGLLFRPRARSGPPDSAPAFVSVPGDCPSVPGFLSGFQPPWIRSAPGPGIIRRAAPARARRHRLPESRPAAWRRAPRTRSRAPAAPRRPS